MIFILCNANLIIESAKKISIRNDQPNLKKENLSNKSINYLDFF